MQNRRSLIFYVTVGLTTIIYVIVRLLQEIYEDDEMMLFNLQIVIIIIDIMCTAIICYILVKYMIMLYNFIRLLKDQYKMNALLCRIIVSTTVILSIGCRIITSILSILHANALKLDQDCSEWHLFASNFNWYLFRASNNLNSLLILSIIAILVSDYDNNG